MPFLPWSASGDARPSGRITDQQHQGSGKTVITGTQARDTLVGTPRAGTIFGLGGNDSVSANAGNDTVQGGLGDDVVTGWRGNDLLNGNPGAADRPSTTVDDDFGDPTCSAADSLDSNRDGRANNADADVRVTG